MENQIEMPFWEEVKLPSKFNKYVAMRLAYGFLTDYLMYINQYKNITPDSGLITQDEIDEWIKPKPLSIEAVDRYCNDHPEVKRISI